MKTFIHSTRSKFCLGISLAVFLGPHFALAQETDAAKRTAAVAKALEFLDKAQTEDGSFSPKAGPGVTAIVTAAMLRSGRTADDPKVAKSLKYLEQFLHEDGGMYGKGSTHTNYETCVAVAAFKEANKDGRYNKLLADAEKYIKEQQWDAKEGQEEASMFYGGAGYGGSSRPDLSNTAFMIDALQSLGRGPDDEAIQKALVFVSRCQNLESPYNTSKFAGKVNDGGFFYTVAGDGGSPAGKTDDGGLRSYGAMTYAGLRSFIYAGLKKDDPRVKAAHDWIKKNYTVKENPGLGEPGLYYYYNTFAKTLSALGDKEFVDSDGKAHDWRADLTNQLVSLQKEDGSWVNKAPRWMESDANLVTAYSLLALSYGQQK